MEEQELINTLSALKQGLDFLNEQNKALNEKIDALSSTLYDDILTPVQDSLTYIDNENKFNEFTGTYGEKTAPYAKEYSVLFNGNDINRDIYDTYKEHADEFEEDSFVNEALNSIIQTIDNAKEALGIKKVEAEVAEDGSTKVKAEVDVNGDGQTETVEASSDDAAEPTAEPEVIETAEDTVDSPEEIAAFEAELEKYKK